MRYIKFRCWDKEDKKIKKVFALDFAEWWVATDYYYGDKFKGFPSGERNSFHNEETDRHILMQFTGLLDKNGKEIYEGDVVLIDDEYFAVSYSEEECAFVVVSDSLNNNLGEYYSREIEVMSNIYENPEMMGGE